MHGTWLGGGNDVWLVGGDDDDSNFVRSQRGIYLLRPMRQQGKYDGRLEKGIERTVVPVQRGIT